MTNCQTGPEAQIYGVHQGYEAFVPARTAIAASQAWPRLNTNKANANLGELCQRFDQEVAAGFDQQPYLQGLAPSLVTQLFTSKEQGDWQSHMHNLWLRAIHGCSEQSPGPRQYRNCIAPLPEWQIFLAKFAGLIRNSDTLLLPLVLAYGEEQEDRRGIFSAKRYADLELLLIATNNGELLWSGKGTGAVSVKQAGINQEYPAYPPWERLYEHLFSPLLWRDFPGRLPRTP